MKFFVIGLGSIGLRHARNLLALGHEVCGYDIFPEKFIHAREELGVPIEVPGRDDMDAYVICTPPSEHYDNMCEAVHAGKHIFVEKPLSDGKQLVQGGLPELLEEAERKNLVVMVGNMLRFHPNVILAKQHIAHPVSATFRVKQKNTKYTEDVILNWGAHEIDLALYLFGPGECVEARGTKDNAMVLIRHEMNGVRSHIYMDYLAEPEARSFTVNTLDALEHNVDLTLHDWNDVYMAEMAAFIDAIETGINLGAIGEDGLATLKIINDAQKMARI